MLGSRGIYHRGWKAVTFHPLGAMYDDGLDPDAPFDDDVWELYDVGGRPVGDERPRRRANPNGSRAMVDLWWEEAARNDVLPLDNRPLFAILNPRPTSRAGSATLRVLPERRARPRAGRGQRAQPLAHDHRRRSRCPPGVVAEGTLLALGSVLGGFTFQLIDGRLRYVHNLYGTSPRRRRQRQRVSLRASTAWRSSSPRPRSSRDGASSSSTGRPSGAGDIPHFTPMTFSYTGGGLTCGYEVGPAIGDGYEAPFRANVDIDRVVVDVSGTAVPSTPQPRTTRSCRSNEAWAGS